MSEVRPQRDDLITATLAAAPSIDRARLTRITLAPGQAPGAHHHPCDVIGIVIGGSIRFTLEGRDEQLLQTGDAFFEPRDTHVLRFDNDSADEPATFLACYLIAPGQDEVIVMSPPPGTAGRPA